jgi:hypothetical protein
VKREYVATKHHTKNRPARIYLWPGRRSGAAEGRGQEPAGEQPDENSPRRKSSALQRRREKKQAREQESFFVPARTHELTRVNSSLRRYLGVAVAEQEEERRHQGDDHRELTRGHVDASACGLA